jgi:hypothetical protein
MEGPMNITSLGFHRHTSRRHFIGTSAAAVGAGALISAGVWTPALAAARRSADPKPIPDGTPVLGGGFHVYGPGFPGLDPADSEPSSITDFKGFVGLAYISGTVVRTQRSTGEKRTLPFLFSDMRFMKGEYRGTDGRARQGTFGFI